MAISCFNTKRGHESNGGLKLGAQGDSLDVLDAKKAAIVVILTAVFAPYIIYMTAESDSISVVALTWMLVFSGDQSRAVFFDQMELIARWPIVLMHCIFVVPIFRYYTGKSTMWRTILIGLLIEFPQWVSYFLIVLPAWGLTSLPLPSSFIAGVLLVWRYPRLEAETLWEGKKETWW
ncbi:MAG: hypothetical protein ACXABY_30490 [Candidatus Thorarchaeota archaeon]|jgi:hypothetical protein